MDYWRLVFDDLSSIDHQDQISNLLEKSFIPNSNLNDIGLLDIIAYGYKQAKKYKESAIWAEMVCNLCEADQKRGSRLNLAKLFLCCNEPERAEFYLGENLKENPNDVDCLVEYSISLYMQNKKLESYELLSKAEVNLKNKFDEISIKNKKIIEFNKGASLIHKGKFKEGIRSLSVGRDLKIWGKQHQFPIPKWKGEIIKGKSVLFIGEGGIGDEIINARFVKHLNDKGMKAGVASVHNLASIFSRMPFSFTKNFTSTMEVNFKDFDYWFPMMDLPIPCDVDSKDLWYGPYISVCPNYREKWNKIVGKKEKIKIGLKWSGNVLYDHDLHRSIPIEEIVKKLSNKFDLYSLQKDNDKAIEGVTNLSTHLENFEDALGAIDQMDIIVSSCTSIPHASAAMGKKTFILLPIMSYYVWSEELDKSSWYGDNLTLIRQKYPRDWSHPINDLIIKINE